MQLFVGIALSAGARRRRVGEHDHPAIDVAERGPPAPRRATRGSDETAALKDVVTAGEEILNDLGRIREAIGSSHGRAVEVDDLDHRDGPFV
jgi:hypothetical protein